MKCKTRIPSTLLLLTLSSPPSCPPPVSTNPPALPTYPPAHLLVKACR
ncbi:hypothetical protein E2C01_090408 [Portunus trituberculatus]|uniref:Uncharacterized protein n=1 Tax=Portunus trituberculatus TaxID=210409 RepID=A0A5B7JQ97_PORTR|nr:hypothetical protein [Portunus trituberculatus]